MTGDRLYINHGRGHHWIKIRLDGVGATFNRAAESMQWSDTTSDANA